MNGRKGRKTAVRLNGFGGEFHSRRANSGWVVCVDCPTGSVRNDAVIYRRPGTQSASAGCDPRGVHCDGVARHCRRPVYFPETNGSAESPAAEGFDPAPSTRLSVTSSKTKPHGSRRLQADSERTCQRTLSASLARPKNAAARRNDRAPWLLVVQWGDVDRVDMSFSLAKSISQRSPDWQSMPVVADVNDRVADYSRTAASTTATTARLLAHACSTRPANGKARSGTPDVRIARKGYDRKLQAPARLWSTTTCA